MACNIYIVFIDVFRFSALSTCHIENRSTPAALQARQAQVKPKDFNFSWAVYMDIRIYHLAI